MHAPNIARGPDPLEKHKLYGFLYGISNWTPTPLCYLCLVFVMLSRLFICWLVVTCWERADRLALVCDVYCVFVTFLCGFLGQVWYLNLSIPGLCRFPKIKGRNAV